MIIKTPTLADIRADCSTVLCWCNACSHNALVDLDELIARYGPTLPFPQIHGKFRCGACGSKDIHAQPNWSESSPGQVTSHQSMKRDEKS